MGQIALYLAFVGVTLVEVWLIAAALTGGAAFWSVIAGSLVWFVWLLAFQVAMALFVLLFSPVVALLMLTPVIALALMLALAWFIDRRARARMRAWRAERERIVIGETR